MILYHMITSEYIKRNSNKKTIKNNTKKVDLPT